jgi:dihydroorotase
VFRRHIVAQTRCRLYAFVHIANIGLAGFPVAELFNISYAQTDTAAKAVAENADMVIGVKVRMSENVIAKHGLEPLQRAIRACEQSGTGGKVMCHIGGVQTRELMSQILDLLRAGDILTHSYSGAPNDAGQGTNIVQDGKLLPAALAAKRRGVIFDAGHGGGSFLFRQAVPATKQGFYPDVISTDLHIQSQNGGMKDILNTMSKFLNLGMPLADVIKANTAKAAEVIKRPDLGHLGLGAEADLAVLNLRRGKFGFIDVAGGKLLGDQKLECELTVKGGQVLWDLNGISRPLWTELKEPSAK